jgi:hypothetical protein
MSAKQMVNKLQRYVSKVRGTNKYWNQRLQELLALIEQNADLLFSLPLRQLTCIV